MLSLPAPEDTRIQHIQQMQLEAFFWAKADMSPAYTIEGGLARVHCNSISMQCKLGSENLKESEESYISAQQGFQISAHSMGKCLRINQDKLG
jgi:hypothetical protein